MRDCFYHFYYFQLTRSMISSSEKANEIKSVLMESLADLNLEDEDIEDVNSKQNDSVHASKRDIPLHENLPKDHNKKKEEPTSLKEVQFVE